MKKQKFVLVVLLVVMLFVLSITSSAHSGKTDAQGGHYDRLSGEYHYHHGRDAHDHYDIDGDGDIDCPYQIKNNYNKEKPEVTFGDIIGALIIATILSYAICALIAILFGKLREKLFKTEKSQKIAFIIAVIVVAVIITFIMLYRDYYNY